MFDPQCSQDLNSVGGTSQTPIHHLLMEMRDHSADAAVELVSRYRPILVRVIRRHLSAQMRPIADTEDFAQTVWRGAMENIATLLELGSEQAIVGYLMKMASFKVISAGRREFAAKRGGTKSRLSMVDKNDAVGTDPTPSEIAIANEQMAQVCQGLNDQQILMVRLRVDGYSLVEIADRLKLNERTVRRFLQRIERKWVSE